MFKPHIRYVILLANECASWKEHLAHSERDVEQEKVCDEDNEEKVENWKRRTPAVLQHVPVDPRQWKLPPFPW